MDGNITLMGSLAGFRGTVEERFWRKVARSDDGCWLWTGWTNPSGYGVFDVARNDRGHRAHRFAWKLSHGPIAAGLHVLHKCDVRNCVNPDHLYLGTHQDNMRDRTVRGRASRLSGAAGERHGFARLSDADVSEIRRLREQEGWLQADLAKRYGVYPSHISNIVNYKARATPTRGRAGSS